MHIMPAKAQKTGAAGGGGGKGIAAAGGGVGGVSAFKSAREAEARKRAGAGDDAGAWNAL